MDSTSCMESRVHERSEALASLASFEGQLPAGDSVRARTYGLTDETETERHPTNVVYRGHSGHIRKPTIRQPKASH